MGWPVFLSRRLKPRFITGICQPRAEILRRAIKNKTVVVSGGRRLLAGGATRDGIEFADFFVELIGLDHVANLAIRRAAEAVALAYQKQ